MNDDIDIRGTNLVNELVDNFRDELMNTPDFYKRRTWHWKRVAEILRRYDVVPTGKLRVVEEVRYATDGSCLRCGYDVMDRSDNLVPTPPPHCPGCGNNIKRPA